MMKNKPFVASVAVVIVCAALFAAYEGGVPLSHSLSDGFFLSGLIVFFISMRRFLPKRRNKFQVNANPNNETAQKAVFDWPCFGLAIASLAASTVLAILTKD